MRRGVAVTSVAAALMVCSIPWTATAAPGDFETYCLPTEPGLAELSGLTSVDGTLYAIGDSGADFRVAVLGSDCAVTRWLDNPVDPYDVEDLSSYGGSLWLADIGDNQSRRDTVALTEMDPVTGAGRLYRLTYPDGPHDAETLLIEPGGRPVIVTKEVSGLSGVYVPEGDRSVTSLAGPGPTPLRKVGDVQFTRTETVGGPPFVVGSILATGGAVSSDGSVATVRTYTDAYLFRIINGDIASALVSTDDAPTVLALPDQPQGEAVTFQPDGSLVVASEAGFGTDADVLPPVLRLADALGRAPAAPEQHETAAATESEWEFRAVVAAAVLLAAGAVFVTVRRARRSG